MGFGVYLVECGFFCMDLELSNLRSRQLDISVAGKGKNYVLVAGASQLSVGQRSLREEDRRCLLFIN